MRRRRARQASYTPELAQSDVSGLAVAMRHARPSGAGDLVQIEQDVLLCLECELRLVVGRLPDVRDTRLDHDRAPLAQAERLYPRELATGIPNLGPAADHDDDLERIAAADHVQLRRPGGRRVVQNSGIVDDRAEFGGYAARR